MKYPKSSLLFNYNFSKKNIKTYTWDLDPFPNAHVDKKRDQAYRDKINERVLKTQVKKDHKTALYIWKSNITQKLRKIDLKSNWNLTNEPLRVKFFDDKILKYVFCGMKHSGVVTEEGHLYMFGDNRYGNLGIGNIENYSHYNPQINDFFIDKDVKVKKVVCSQKNTLVLSEDGNLFTFGYGGSYREHFAILKTIGLNGDWEIIHRWYPAGLSYFLYNGIVARDIASGNRHFAVLDYQGNVYNWGSGIWGKLGTGSRKNHLIPIKLKFFEDLRKSNPEERVIKIDCGEDYTAALTKSGNIYSWGLNNQGQLGTGGGSGKDYIEIEKIPTLVVKESPVKYVDFYCGENTMIIKDDKGNLHKTGLKLNYTPGLIEASVNIKAKSFFCGRSFYGMIDNENNVYQWGNLFKKSKVERNNDLDMLMIKSQDLFHGKEIVSISSKYAIAAAIIKENI